MRAKIPPWEPIADWLARLEAQADEQTRRIHQQGTLTQNAIRKEYETEAKAIAYDIAMHGDGPEQKRTPVEVCPKCEGHGGIPGDRCERCEGTGQADKESNI